MYQLLVFYPEHATHPAKRVEAPNAEAVFALIPKLLEEHDGCERIVIMMGLQRLFSVDCDGNRLP